MLLNFYDFQDFVAGSHQGCALESNQGVESFRCIPAAFETWYNMKGITN